ncbi:MAG TPA: hypothetical protein VF748_11570, partial [Candidatus Acidoferrum sp.]
QQAILEKFLARCGVAGRRSLAASVFGQLHASFRATFVGITQAMMNTSLTDKRDGQRLGDAFGLIQELIDIQGENTARSSDEQFQLIVLLAPDALGKLDRAASFLKGENHFFHKDYPISFRQFRRIGLRGQEAGLHFCLTRDARFAQIHIDYRFGLLHLGPANSDVRAEGNHQRHADRWPEFTLAERAVRVSCPARPAEFRCEPELGCARVRSLAAIFECNFAHGKGILLDHHDLSSRSDQHCPAYRAPR